MIAYPGPGIYSLDPRPSNVRHCLICGASLEARSRNAKYCPAGPCRVAAQRAWAEREKARKRRERDRDSA